MLALDSPRWHELRDAYGPAGHIPEILRSCLDGEPVLMALYDAFALIGRNTATEAAITAVPHVVRAAETCPVDERLDYLVFVGRVAYAAYGATSGMDADLVAEAMVTFERASALAQLLLAQTAEGDAIGLIATIIALEQCPLVYDALYDLGHGEVRIVCPADTCGVQMEIVPRGDGLIATVDEDEVEVEHAAPAAFDAARPWTEADALPRAAGLARAAGHASVANRVALLHGIVACPHCGERLSIVHEILEPSDL